MIEKTLRWLLCFFLLLLLAPAGCSTGTDPSVSTANGLSMVSRTNGRYFQVYNRGSWNWHVVKGANIGASMPGRWFGELAIPKSMYARWLDQIGGMGANNVLVYSLVAPAFYEALVGYNRAHPHARIWLIQQVWPRDENVQANLYLPRYVNEYKKEIRLAVDALMGKADIGERTGLAWGKYKVNVMPYVLGMLIGRELQTAEVKATDGQNPQKTTLQGRFVQTTPTASPMEVWVADMADTVASRVRKYDWDVPVGFVSWPTLDPLVHPTENTPGFAKSREVDDSQVLNPRHLGPATGQAAGFFGMYQIYPYYPEFMYRQPSYARYKDSEGVLRYGGYLQEFMSVLPPYPALVGEYGLPTSVSSSHQQPEGLSQGEINEKTQGKELTRLYKAILREGYAGGLVFEWADEWAKRNWVTMSYMVPFDRHVLWDNVTDPEQCFGLLTYLSARTVVAANMKKIWQNPVPATADGEINALYADADEAFLYLALDVKGASGLLPGSSTNMVLDVGISTLGKGHGTTRLPVDGLPLLPQGAELLLQISGQQTLLLNRPDYSRSTSRFWAAPATDPAFEHVTYVINREQVSTDGTYFPTITTDQSKLKYGVFDRKSPEFDSLGNWYIDPTTGRGFVRLPWGLINVTDPSSLQVIYDTSRQLPPGPTGMRNLALSELGTMKTPGFLFFAAVSTQGKLVDFGPRAAGSSSFKANAHPYAWRGWETPSYTETLKQSYPYIKSLYTGISSTQMPPAETKSASP
jgi:hypothetical protein